MPRKPRLSIPGALHHVMARGIEGRQIFVGDDDRQMFLSLLAGGIARTGFKCYAWVLMGNHYHLLLRANENPLSELMRPLNSKYARWIRKKEKNRGYLFQDRFKSLVTQDQGYVEELVRYIHLNPVRAGICRSIDELDRYTWCGHAGLVGNRKYDFQNTNDVLRRFGEDNRIAIAAYREFIIRGMVSDNGREFSDIIRKGSNEKVDQNDYKCWVIGDLEFVKSAFEHDKARRLRIASYQKEGVTIQTIVDDVAQQMGIEASEMLARGRENDRSIGRKIVAAIAHRTYGIPITEIARHFNVGHSSISRMLEQGVLYTKKRAILIKH
jgi:putative transposase